MARTPPVNFSLVCPGVYRSAFPTTHNLSFLQRLGLRTIVTLESIAYEEATRQWIEACGITVVHCTIAQSKEPFVVADTAEIQRCIRILVDPTAQPVLVHSLRGQSRVGVVMGCLRRLQRWSIAAVFEEYRRFAGPAATLLDLQVIELHEADGLWDDDAALLAAKADSNGQMSRGDSFLAVEEVGDAMVSADDSHASASESYILRTTDETDDR